MASAASVNSADMANSKNHVTIKTPIKVKGQTKPQFQTQATAVPAAQLQLSFLLQVPNPREGSMVTIFANARTEGLV